MTTTNNTTLFMAMFVCQFCTVICVIMLGLTVKLYTEFIKEKKYRQ